MRCRGCSEAVVEIFTAALLKPDMAVLIVPRTIVEICLEALDIALQAEQENGDCQEND